MWLLKSPEEKLNYHSCYYYKNVFSKEDCDRVIEQCSMLSQIDATVGNPVSSQEVNKSIRTSSISWVPTEESYQWIYRKCTDLVNIANKEFFNYNLDYIEDLQFTKYDSSTNSFYGKHHDIAQVNKGSYYRKLSFTIQLNDPSSYSGGDLILNDGSKPSIIKRDLGEITLFPSYVLHEVTPVTAGIRNTLVGWVCGKPFR